MPEDDDLEQDDPPTLTDTGLAFGRKHWPKAVVGGGGGSLGMWMLFEGVQIVKNFFQSKLVAEAEQVQLLRDILETLQALEWGA
tara:strand:- start:1487 stop:1738 length:252 start_codon:yes stop_codon:yes gene_type:complete